MIDPRRALEFKRHLATYMKRLDGEAACLTSILESGGGFTATEALRRWGRCAWAEPDGRAARTWWWCTRSDGERGSRG